MKLHELLGLYAKILNAYGNAVSKIYREYGINQTCSDVLIFLKNNPEHDTASSIVEIRGLKKGMVSVAIEQLFQSDLLVRIPDESDRRVQHLKLTEKSLKLAAIGQQLQNDFQNQLFSKISSDEQKCLENLSEKMLLSLSEMKGTYLS